MDGEIMHGRGISEYENKVSDSNEIMKGYKI